MKKPLLILLSFLLFHQANAQIIEVPGDYETIQMAIDNAEPLDTVWVHEGTYIENVFIDKNIVLLSDFYFSNDPEDIQNTVIDGDMEGSCLEIRDVSEDLIISGFSITNGSGTFYTDTLELSTFEEEFKFGGGVFVEDCSSIVFDHCNIHDNEGTFPTEDFGDHSNGGGLFCVGSVVFLQNCTIDNNLVHASSFMGEGGGICSFNCDLVINDCVISNNSSFLDFGYATGGGIRARRGTLSISDTEIFGNSSSIGGGIVVNSCNTYIDNTFMYSNHCDASGSAISTQNWYSEDSELIITECEIYDNSNEYNGNAAVHITDNTEALVNYSLIYDNQSGPNGGAFNVSNSILHVDNCELFGNLSQYPGGSGGGQGGALDAWQSEVYMDNTTIANNTAFSGGGFDEGGAFAMYYSELYLNECNVSGNISNRGGVFSAFFSEIELFRTLVHSNSASDVAAVLNTYECDVRILNSTIAENATGTETIATTNDSLLVVNSIIWNEGMSEIRVVGEEDPSFILVDYSTLRGETDNIEGIENLDLEILENNIWDAPQFEDVVNGDFHLVEGSAQIDTGTDVYFYDGQLVLHIFESDYSGSNPDMGAFEWMNPDIVEEIISEHILYFIPSARRLQSEKPIKNLRIWNVSGQLMIDRNNLNFDLNEGLYLYSVEFADGALETGKVAVE